MIDQLVNRLGIGLLIRRNRQADCVQLDARFSDFRDELIDAGLVGVLHDLIEMADAERGHYGMDAKRQVGQAFAQFKQLLQPLLEFLEIARYAANVVVFLTDAVQRQVDDEPALGARLGNAAHLVGDGRKDAISRDVDNARLAVLVGHLAEFDDALEHEWFAAADGEPVGRLAERAQHFVPLVER